jgi:hypothetical protein
VFLGSLFTSLSTRLSKDRAIGVTVVSFYSVPFLRLVSLELSSTEDSCIGFAGDSYIGSAGDSCIGSAGNSCISFAEDSYTDSTEDGCISSAEDVSIYSIDNVSTSFVSLAGIGR